MPWTVAAVFAPDAEGGLSPVGARIVEERHEAGAVDACGDFEIAEFGQGAVDVERLDDARGGAAVAVGSGGVDDERDAGAVFEERAGLGPLSFFAELIAVVGDEDDDGVIAQAEFVEMGEDAAEVPVGPGDGGEVGADDLLWLRPRMRRGR